MMRTISIDVLKAHYPACSRIFDQIAETKASEREYKKLKQPKENEHVEG